jgi:hypothetical protein
MAEHSFIGGLEGKEQEKGCNKVCLMSKFMQTEIFWDKVGCKM